MFRITLFLLYGTTRIVPTWRPKSIDTYLSTLFYTKLPVFLSSKIPFLRIKTRYLIKLNETGEHTGILLIGKA